jgi:hypothetical protein
VLLLPFFLDRPCGHWLERGKKREMPINKRRGLMSSEGQWTGGKAGQRQLRVQRVRISRPRAPGCGSAEVKCQRRREQESNRAD